MNILNAIFAKKETRFSIVQKLLESKAITAKEAAILLEEKIVINVQRLEMSSGAKIVYGDDNETEYR